MNKYERIVKKFCDKANSGKHRMSPMSAIRAKCLDCTCYQAIEVTKCDIKECPLWRFRSGRNLTAPRVAGRPQKGIISSPDALAQRQKHGSGLSGTLASSKK